MPDQRLEIVDRPEGGSPIRRDRELWYRVHPGYRRRRQGRACRRTTEGRGPHALANSMASKRLIKLEPVTARAFATIDALDLLIGIGSTAATSVFPFNSCTTTLHGSILPIRLCERKTQSDCSPLYRFLHALSRRLEPCVRQHLQGAPPQPHDSAQDQRKEGAIQSQTFHPAASDVR